MPLLAPVTTATVSLDHLCGPMACQWLSLAIAVKVRACRLRVCNNASFSRGYAQACSKLQTQVGFSWQGRVHGIEAGILVSSVTPCGSHCDHVSDSGSCDLIHNQSLDACNKTRHESRCVLQESVLRESEQAWQLQCRCEPRICLFQPGIAFLTAQQAWS